jgi:hypothetical protein
MERRKMLKQIRAAKKMMPKRVAWKTVGLWDVMLFGCRMMGACRGPPSQHDITTGLDHRLARTLEGCRNAVGDCRYGSRAGLELCVCGWEVGNGSEVGLSYTFCSTRY